MTINNHRGTSGYTGFPIKSSEGTIKDVVEMTLEGLSLLEDIIKGASQFE
jgi:hypothetical protein